jgi:hypothetical protein
MERAHNVLEHRRRYPRVVLRLFRRPAKTIGRVTLALGLFFEFAAGN